MADKKIELTEKETKAFKAIIDNAVAETGHRGVAYLLEDNFSWFDRKDISKAGFSKFEASGLMSSLSEKGLIYEADPPLWALTEEGIQFACIQEEKGGKNG